MKDEIKSIFQNVNEWLKFAEAKHAGLLVLNSGVIFGILAIYKDYQSCLPKIIILLTLIFFGLSMLLSIVSLFPRTHNVLSKQKKIKNPNLYFAGHLCKLDVDDFKAELHKIKPTHVFDRFEDDLLNQIIVNATITTRKYHLFKLATVSTIVGFIIPLTTLILKLICHY